MPKIPYYLLISALFTTSIDSFAEDPRSVQSCDRTLHLKQPPSRAVANDINLTEMMFALKLQSRMAGYSGISDLQKLNPEFKKQAGKLPHISEKSPNIASLLAVDADFLFAGWNYGMRVGGPLTPSTLKEFNIEVYELSESCIHIMDKKISSFEDVYRDIERLGILFSVEDRASKWVSELKSELKEITEITKEIKNPVSVFVYDSGKDSPFTSGEYAIPNAMIEAAGGVNIVNDLKSSWTRTNWETVVNRNPDVIVIVNYGVTTAKQKIAFLRQHPALTDVSAIQQQRFVVLEYNEATPGIRNVQGTGKLAKSFYPDLFPVVANIAVQKQASHE